MQDGFIRYACCNCAWLGCAIYKSQYKFWQHMDSFCREVFTRYRGFNFFLMNLIWVLYLIKGLHLGQITPLSLVNVVFIACLNQCSVRVLLILDSLRLDQKDASTLLVLSSHLQLQKEGFLSTWTNSFVGPWDPSQGLHNPGKVIQLRKFAYFARFTYLSIHLPCTIVLYDMSNYI